METQSYDVHRLTESSVLNSKWFNPEYLFDHGFGFLKSIFNFFSGSRGEIGALLDVIFFLLIIFFSGIIIYSIIKIFEIRKREHEFLHHEILEYAQHQAEKEERKNQENAVSKNERWVRVLALVFSPNSGDWKLAVLEADSMLDALLSELGFKGVDIGEKLRFADRDKFRSLSQAWEVHAVRNRIAHEGGFELSAHEAKRLVALYEQIFREFGYI